MRWLPTSLACLVLLFPVSAAAQTELLTIFPGPSPTERVVVRRVRPGEVTRDRVDGWLIPSNGSGEAPNVSVGLVRGTRRPRARTFTLVTPTAACVVRSTDDVTLFSSITFRGHRLAASILSASACPDALGVLAGSEPDARIARLTRDPSALTRLPTPLPAQAEHQTPLTAPGSPFVVLGGTDLSTGVAFAFCDRQLVAQRPAYAWNLMTSGERTFLVAQPVAFADGALWRSELVPLVCPR